MPQTGFTPIITYNTATASLAPVAGKLTQGELAVNVTDKKIYTKDSGGTVVQVGSGPSAQETLTNKTIAAASNTLTGVVTAVSGTAPVVSSGGTTPAISMGAASSGVNGYMTGTYATKLDGIATGATANTGTVTGVSGTAPVVSSGGTAPAISMAAATASVNGYMTSTYASKLDGIAAGATAVGSGTNLQVNSLGVGTGGSGTAGEIRATNNITAYYSDDRLKTRTGVIEDALGKLATLDTFYYHANEVAVALGYDTVDEVGISAQQVQAIMPQVVAPAPIDDQYLTVRYERLVPLLIAAINELHAEVNLLRGGR